MNAVRDAYPKPQEVDAWSESVLQRAEAADLQVTVLEQPAWPFRLGVRHTGGVFLQMRSEELGEFYCFWQRCPSGGGPLLLHMPGYGAELSAHPELVADGYNVLHINPLGFGTPNGPDDSKKKDGIWPVLPDTARSLGKAGYVDWLAQAAAASLWAMDQDGVEGDRFAFFGTSQGGRGSIALGSIFRDRGVRAVAADVPGLCDLPGAIEREAGSHHADLCAMVKAVAEGTVRTPLMDIFKEMADRAPEDLPAAVKAVGYVDATSHARRLTMPVLLTAGGADTTCPAEGIFTVFQMLPGTRSYTEIAGQGHAYTTPFLHLARAWFRLYV